MKRIIKTTISIMLILMMVLSSVSMVFAGSSSSESYDWDAHYRRIEEERIRALQQLGAGSEAAMATNSAQARNTNVYCLNIDTGIVSKAAKLKYILISYTGPTGHETIMLDPSVKTGNAVDDLRYGSYAQSLNYMNSVIKTTNPELATNLEQSKNFAGLDLSLKADPDPEGGYFPKETNIDLYFKPTYKITSIDKVSFFFSDSVTELGNKTSGGDTESKLMYSWSVNSISIYDLGVPESVFTSANPGIAYYSYSLATKDLYSTFRDARLITRIAPPAGKNGQTSGDFSWVGDQLVVVKKTMKLNPNGSIAYVGSNIPAANPYVIEPIVGESSLNTKKIDPSKVATAIVSLDIADVYGAGMDSMCAPVGGKMPAAAPPTLGDGKTAEITEPLMASIAYYTEMIDANTPNETSVRYVDIPVMTNFMLYWAQNLSSGEDGNAADKNNLVRRAASFVASGNVITAAQQGETIAFPVSLPNFVMIKNVTFEYENSIDHNDSITFNGINVFLPEDYSFTSTADNGQVLITPSPDNIPMYVGRLGSTQSLSVYPSGRSQVSVMENTTNEPYSAPAYETRDKYLITLKTPNFDLAATKDDILINFSYYTTGNMEATTQDIVVRDNIADFYGYWPGLKLDDSTTVDAAYNVGMSKNRELHMIVELKNVNQFTGFTIKGDPSMEDEYQLGGLSIERLTYLSSRKQTRVQETDYNGVRIDREYTRNYQAETLFDKDNLNLLIQKGDSKTYEFLSQKVKKEKKVRDFSDQEYSMDEETAMGDLGFTDAVSTYEVQLQVASNNLSATRDDDCGSNNLFYIQLCFKNGHTGYVLANNQIAADGFRAGATETIGFSTNQDFGNVTGINIIPEDRDPNSDVLDKLNLDSIKVIKHNEGSVDQVFTIDNVGWVSKEYKSSASRGYAESGGRSAAEMLCYYPIGNASYSLTLEFTLQYSDKVKEENQNVAEAGVLMDLTYVNTNGETKTLSSVDIVKAMYEYQGASPKLKNDRIITNKKSMMKPGTRDRFFVHIDDAASLVDCTLNLYGMERSYLFLSSCFVRAVYGDRELKLNNDGEYEYDFVDDPIDICYGMIKDPIEMCFTGNGQVDHYTFKFEENELPKVDSDNKLVPPVPREPESTNDRCRAFIYMNPSSSDPSETENFSVKLTYSTTVYDYESIEALTYAGDQVIETESGPKTRRVYYADLSTPRMSDLKDVAIEIDNAPAGHNYEANEAVVMQIREDVVIRTYHVNMGTCIISLAMRSAHGNGAPMVVDEEGSQKLMIHLSADSESYHLYPETHDVAIRLKYLTSCEQLSGLEKNMYTTKFIYLTDQQIEEIHAGSMVTLTFKVPYLYELVEVDMLATGGITDAKVDAIFGLVYDANEKLVTTLSVDHTEKPETIGGVATIFVPSAEQFTPIILTLGTAGVSSESAGTAIGDVKATLYYQTSEYQDVVTIDDLGFFATDSLRSWISSGSLSAGENAEVWLPLKSVHSVRYIDLEPAGTDASWGLYSLKVERLNSTTGMPDLLAELNPEMTLVEGHKQRINFSKVSMNVNVKYTTLDLDGTVNENGNNTLESNGIDPNTGKKYIEPLSQSIAVLDQKFATFKGVVKQSTEGYYCDLYYDVNGVQCKDTSANSPVQSGKVYTADDTIEFQVNSSVADKYTLVFTSVENSKCVVVYNIAVVGIKEPEKEEETPTFDTEEEYQEWLKKQEEERKKKEAEEAKKQEEEKNKQEQQSTPETPETSPAA